MSCTVVIGAQWGDEGKAKMIDYYSSDADIIVRYQGGANAGHTVVVGGKKYVFHLIPSGILHPGKICVLGNGVVLDPLQMVDEMDKLIEQGIDIDYRIFISDAAHLILPYHKALDSALEEMRAENKIGTTGRGIGPCYADKCFRTGIRVGDLYDEKYLEEKITQTLKIKNLQLEKLHGRDPYSVDEIMDICLQFKARVEKMIINTAFYLNEESDKGKKIILEGAQGFGLDIDHGTYPFVTSSNPTVGGALLGTGINNFQVNRVVGIAKAYITRVGEGPFPTEDFTESGNTIREKGHEYGATTGRPRRCGWFDVELLKQAKRICGFTEIALIKLDILSGFKKIKVATGYQYEGKKIEMFPSFMLDKVKPVYTELDGWDEDISACKKYEDLPEKARNYIDFLEEKIGIRIAIIGVGPGREDTIIRN
ncbi:MAG: adenylosuccinate synthase [Spirochaetes bacterium]|nr:adenylosuccinate synthase [Spirochaetota bacterium]